MHVVFLRFSTNHAEAASLMPGHRAWLDRGFKEGVFLLAGSLEPGLGGTLLAHDITTRKLETFLQQDPFVAENVVTAEIFEVAPSRVDPRLQFVSASDAVA